MVRSVAKYDWIKLEKEYILGDYKSVSAFLKEKGIPNNGSSRKQTSGWNGTKRQKEDKKKTKTIEKVIEKQSEQEAKKIVTVNSVANKLLEKIMCATEELNKNVDMFGNLHENSIVNKADLKKLTSALKDVNDILQEKENNQSNDGIIVDLIGALKDVKNNR